MPSQEQAQTSDAITASFILAVAGAFLPLCVTTLIHDVQPYRIAEGGLLLSVLGGIIGFAVGLLLSYSGTEDTPAQDPSRYDKPQTVAR